MQDADGTTRIRSTADGSSQVDRFRTEVSASARGQCREVHRTARHDAASREDRAPQAPRWPASLAASAALILYITLPERLTFGPGWMIPALEAALIIFLTVAAPSRHIEEARAVRLASLLLIVLVNVANLASLALLVHLVLSGGAASGRQLIFSGLQIWLTLVLVFALWYWEVDRGGPGLRGSKAERAPDFLFPQMATPELHQGSWMPNFLDYLYVAFTNATAFSPTDTMPLTSRAKALMLIESLAAITAIVMIAGRAVNILK
ncbi:MAG: hypothetical protein QOD46_1069 [Actinomycetota bacterium]|nr:hypothetical protein [Actinomycetota bacterium]